MSAMPSTLPRISSACPSRNIFDLNDDDPEKRHCRNNILSSRSQLSRGLQGGSKCYTKYAAFGELRVRTKWFAQTFTWTSLGHNTDGLAAAPRGSAQRDSITQRLITDHFTKNGMNADKQRKVWEWYTERKLRLCSILGAEPVPGVPDRHAKAIREFGLTALTSPTRHTFCHLDKCHEVQKGVKQMLEQDIVTLGDSFYHVAKQNQRCAPVCSVDWRRESLAAVESRRPDVRCRYVVLTTLIEIHIARSAADGTYCDFDPLLVCCELIDAHLIAEALVHAGIKCRQLAGAHSGSGCMCRAARSVASQTFKPGRPRG